MSDKAFRGEVWNNIDPYVLTEIVRINGEPVDGKVGKDSYTAMATEYIQSFFDREVGVLYTVNGTAANVIALKVLLDRFGSVICAEQAHINTYECGAVEYNLGNKILTVSSSDAKLTPKALEKLIKDERPHGYKPQVIAITQPTELGTLYSLAEIKAIADFAHSRGMKLFIDGARLGSALASLGVAIREMILDTGVDAFTVGGTKAGAMLGEAVVFVNKDELAAGDYVLKQSLQHFDKSKFLGAQMLALFRDNRWIKNFDHANKMAKLLEKELKARGVQIYLPVESNMVFCVIDEASLEKMNKEFDLKYWFADNHVVRIATTFATTEQDISRLVATLD